MGMIIKTIVGARTGFQEDQRRFAARYIDRAQERCAPIGFSDIHISAGIDEYLDDLGIVIRHRCGE